MVQEEKYIKAYTHTHLLLGVLEKKVQNASGNNSQDDQKTLYRYTYEVWRDNAACGKKNIPVSFP